jgi:hypothetical protein
VLSCSRYGNRSPQPASRWNGLSRSDQDKRSVHAARLPEMKGSAAFEDLLTFSRCSPAPHAHSFCSQKTISPVLAVYVTSAYRDLPELHRVAWAALPTRQSHGNGAAEMTDVPLSIYLRATALIYGLRL